MSRALTARMKALRVKAQAIPVATPTLSVFAASQVAWVTLLRNSSGVQTQSMPAASAAWACSARSSARVADRRYLDAVEGRHAQPLAQALSPYSVRSSSISANGSPSVGFSWRS